MKFFRIDLLTLLISLFILNSCKNQDTTGFTLGIKGNLSGSLVDTSTVYTKTQIDSPLVTSDIGKSPLGYMNDPVFGITQSDIITDLNLPGSTAYTLPAGSITIDSAVLILKYAKNGFYGDSTSTSKYVINVYQLSQKQVTNATYYGSSTFSHQSTLLGSTTQLNHSFAPRPNTSVIIDSSVTGTGRIPDTIPPQIRIPINKTFLNNNLFNAGSTALASNLIFNNNVKGLYISVDKTQSTGPGGMMLIKGDSISVNVYIRAVSGSVIDTTIVNLPVTQYASAINRVRSTALQSAITNTTSVSDSLVYLQGLAGTRVKVKFPFIDSLFSNRNVGGVKNIIINRAELVISVNDPPPGSNPYVIPDYLAPLPRLTMYQLDIANQPVEIPDASGLTDASSITAFGGYLYTNIKPRYTYHFLVTAYLQNLLVNKTVDYGTFIAAADTSSTLTSVPIIGTPEMPGRAVLGGGYINAAGAKNSPYSMRLNVIYTKIK